MTYPSIERDTHLGLPLLSQLTGDRQRRSSRGSPRIGGGDVEKHWGDEHPPRRPSLTALLNVRSLQRHRLLRWSVVALAVLAVLYLSVSAGSDYRRIPIPSRAALSSATNEHNLCRLKTYLNQGHEYSCKIETARKQHAKMLNRQSASVSQARATYEERYGRSPPPGFDDWVEFALQHKSPIIDDYDQIEKDLRPFRDIPPAILKVRLADALHDWPTDQLGSIEVRKGNLTIKGLQEGVMSAPTLEKILQPVLTKLPDLVILFNWYAEPRVIKSEPSRETSVTFMDYSKQPTWDLLSRACYAAAKYGYGLGAASSVCGPRAEERLRKYHGFFNAPDQLRPTRALVPMISRAKLSGPFADILAPNVCYSDDNWRQPAMPDTIPFAVKNPSLYWRGSSTGQEATIDNWHSSHRLRNVYYMQWLTRLSAGVSSQLDPTSQIVGSMAKHVKAALDRLPPSTFNAGISRWLNCELSVCRRLQRLMGTATTDVPHTAYLHKFVLDLDGQSMSCRYYRLLQSNSITFKSTIWDEWHDDRLIPWLHYVPLSVHFQETPLLLDYFLNDPKGKENAEIIARSSREWTQESLRVIDLTIYYYRLLIEYASLFDA